MKRAPDPQSHPFTPAMWLAVILMGCSLLLAVARCSPETIEPFVDYCEDACEAGEAACIAVAALLPGGWAEDLAVVGCHAGGELCTDLGCKHLNDWANGDSKAAKADPCLGFREPCIEAGHAGACEAGYMACREYLGLDG